LHYMQSHGKNEDQGLVIAVLISNEIRDSITKQQTIQSNPMSAVCCAMKNQRYS